MHYSTAIAGLAALTASVVNAQSGWTVKVAVGADGLTYTPNNIVAAVGTNVEFTFSPKNHTVTQSSFADPCHPLANGFFSDFVPTTETPSSTTFTITVKDSKPIWFYCSQTVGSHCQKGMVGAINAPLSGNTLAKFTALAANATLSTFPSGGVANGVLNFGSSSNSTSSTSSVSVVTSTVTETAYGYSTYTSAGQTYTTTVATQTVVETYVIAATATNNVASSTTSGPAKSTGINAASDLSAHLFGVAAVGLGALAMM
jgi:plastocyanin